jgi:N-acetylneuraminic acid mutarotase
VGGLLGQGASRRVEVYNPTTDRWRGAPDLPVSLHHVMTAFYRGELVVLGGWIPNGNNISAVTSDRVLALRGGAWVDLSKLNHARAAGAAAVVGNSLVVVGGQADGKLVTPTEIFDGTRWRDGADIPTARDHLAAATDQRYLYAVGGRVLGADRNLGTLERYEPLSDRWVKLPDMPTPRGGLGAAVTTGRLVALGGEFPTGVFATAESFNLTTQVWSSLPDLPTGRHGLGVAAIGPTVYAVVGGLQPAHSAPSPIGEAMDLA